jgi:diaminohydroxyphosphoribosylaminopyrimidine deaminase/5-amino-6-(5-phosphoribosylamino)uracil reductase
MPGQTLTDEAWMRLALRLAARAEGQTSPNPMVGAILVRHEKKISQGWHRFAGGPHAELEAFRAAMANGVSARGATLYVTLEPCCTHGRTPPCTQAILASGVRRVVVAATDPNPVHAGRGLRVLRRAGLIVVTGVLEAEATRLNEAFNHWIIHRTPYVLVKAAMTLDGKIATASGESQWITSVASRNAGMALRKRADAILVGVNTVRADDPQLTARTAAGGKKSTPRLRRIVLDSQARTPLNARLMNDELAALTTIVTTRDAPRGRVAALSRRVTVWQAPARRGLVDLRWLLRRLGSENVTQLLVEGGGEVNASFLLAGLAHQIAFFVAPKILGGRDARRAVAGAGIERLSEIVELDRVEWRRLGPDLMLQALVKAPPPRRRKH